MGRENIIEFDQRPPSRGELLDAVKKGDTEKVETLLKAGANPNDTVTDDLPPLLWAVTANNIPMVKALIDYGADIHSKRGDFGRTPLLWAAKKGCTDIVALLLDKGVDINATDDNGRDAVMAAAEGNKLMTLRLLVERGAALGEQDNAGHSALEMAKQLGHAEIVQLLEAAPALRQKQAAAEIDKRARDSAGPLRHDLPVRPPLRFPRGR